MSGTDRNEDGTGGSSLWRIFRDKNGEKYLTFSGNRNKTACSSSGGNLMNETHMIDSQNQDGSGENFRQIKLYKMRWYILAVISLANISNAINWIIFSPIADYTAQFYSVDYDSVNNLSLIYLILSTPAGFFSFWLIDNFGIRTSINLGAWLNLIGASVRQLTAIDKSDGTPLITQSNKYTILMIGQSICATAQTFIMLVTTKFANNWFSEDQRALANTLALASNTLGILIGAFFSPQVVNSSLSFISEMFTLLIISLAISMIPAIMACFITRSNPPTPPSYSSIVNDRRNRMNNDASTSSEYLINENEISEEDNSFCTNFKIYLGEISKLMKSKDFLILFFSFGLALGIFNTLTTLIEQIVCVRGYTDEDAGYFGAALIISGLVGSILAGIILDKTKRFEEMSKICFGLSSLANIFFVIVQLYDNSSTNYALILISFILFGFFGVPLLPICMEMAVECVYPIPEATSTGLLFIAGQVVGIVLIVAYPKLSTKIHPNTYIYNSLQTCTGTTATSNSSLFTSTTTTTAKPNQSLLVLDYTYPLYAQTILMVLIAVGFISFFKCAYLRLRSEREKLAEKILSSARS